MSPKTPPTDLVRDVADEFNTYIGRGVRIGPLSEEVDPNLNIDNLDTVLRIHFLLQGDKHGDASTSVREFVEVLPNRIRRLETAIERRTSTVRGGIRGQIDWQASVKQQSQQGLWDPTRYVCRESEKELDTPENVILKRLLGELLSILEEDLQTGLDQPDRYPWLERWVADPNLYAVLDRVYRQNIYFSRISDDVDITDRMVRSVKRARQPLYREAAELLAQYRRLMRYNLETNEEAKDVLRHSFIIPDQQEYASLFELYWIFRLLRQYPEAEFKVIDERSDLTARWTIDEYEYVVYNDVMERDGVRFKIGRDRAEVDADLSAIDETRSETGYFEREAVVVDQSTEMGAEAFGTTPSGTLWSGRPDILMMKRQRDTDSLEAVLFGEVKYTQDEQYMVEGLEQLLEYTYYAQDAHGSYLVDTPPEIPGWIYPVLFVDSGLDRDGYRSLPVDVYTTDDEFDLEI